MNAKISTLSILAAIFFSLSGFAQPVINSFSPSSGQVGTTVIITGNNFSNVPLNNAVYFGGIKATVSNASVTSLTVTVPVGAVQSIISVTTNNLTGYSAQPFMISFPGGGVIAGKSFDLSAISTGLFPYGITSADFDGDGKPDVATVNNANVPGTYVSVHKNTGGNGVIAFSPKTDLVLGDFGYGITAADFDGDGKQDIAATFIASDGNVSIYKNNSVNGSITFAPEITYPCGNSPYTVIAADIDKDGKPDLVICNSTENTMSVLRNTSTSGNISFASKISFLTSLNPWDLAVSDLDRDGKLDVITSNRFSNNISAIRNLSTPGTISFATRIDYATGNSPLGIASADLDGDNKPDIACINPVDNSVSVLRNTSTVGSFSFSTRMNIPLPGFPVSGPKRIVISDVDADTKPEMIVSGDNLHIFKNNSTAGTISFGTGIINYVLYPYRIEVADLDMDGKPDIAVTSVSGEQFNVLKNKVPLPQVSSFSPTTAAAGATIQINGYNFNGVTTVTIGGVPVTSYTVNNPNSISAVVSSGASGTIKVTAQYGEDSATGFVFAGPPVISSFTPASAKTGDQVIIKGQNFNNATNVSFGGLPVSSFRVISPGEIEAIVGFGSSGNISITTQYGTGSLSGFTYLPIPAVNSFSPQTAATGTIVTINGYNFTGITGVSFGGVAASSFTVVSPSVITAVVPNGASGSVSVTNSSGTGSQAGFTYLPPSIITSFTPTSAGAGTMVTINGSNFTGVTSVKFGNSNAFSFSVVSPTVITAVVWNGASGNVSVTNNGGTASLPGFVFIPKPDITSFTPKVSGTGGVVTITGTNFSTATSVSFGGSAASSFTVVDPTTIHAIIGSGTDGNGSVSVTTIGGNATLGGFGFSSSPVINSFSPASGPVGTTVTITGANFNLNASSNIVYFGGVRANVISSTANSIVVDVPFGANRQPITITTNNKTAYSKLPFDVTFSGGGTFNLNSFAGRVDFPTQGNPESIASGDLDGDGLIDVIVANTYSNTISFFRNTSTLNNLSFAPKIDSSAGLYPHAVKIADMDGDGKLDVLLLNAKPNGNLANENTLTIFKNTSTPGNLSFSSKMVIVTDFHPVGLAVADLNLDGKPDVAITHYGTSYNNREFISVYKNNSTTTISFAQVQTLYITSSTLSGLFLPASITVADLDNNDHPDLVIGFDAGDFITVLSNNSSIASPFVSMQDKCFGGCWFGSGYQYANTTDFNGDGKIDVITQSRTLRNLHNGTSLSFDIQGANGLGGIIAIDNLSGTIKPDFVRVNTATNTVSAVKNLSTSGSLSFAPDVNFNVGTYPRGVTTADFNGDGKPDIAVTNRDFNTFSILLNNAGNSNPLITSFTPTIGGVGTLVTIKGSNFTGITGVSFGGVAASSFTVVDVTTITAVTNSGASGNVAITSSNGTASLGWFYFTPTITSFTPVNAGAGITVTITGNEFTGATAVSFGGVPAASFTVLSPTTISAVVSSGSSGEISVTTPAGTATISGFVFVAAPTITSYTPTSGGTGTLITITGTNFTGATKVQFGNSAASSFTVISPTTITAVVGNGETGNIFVTTPGGTAYLAGQLFNFIPAPGITSFAPTIGGPGTTITITGSNFTGATAVNFGGVAATSFTVVNATTITAVVGNGATGNITITTAGGTVTSPGFIYSIPTALPGVYINSSAILIYPNPATENIIIDHPSRPKTSTVRIIDMYGRIVKEIIIQRNTGRSQLNIKDLSSGIYQVEWNDGRNLHVKMFTKIH